MNRMRDVRIEKVTINMGCGGAGDKLEKAKGLMNKLVDKTVVVTKTQRRSTFGGTKGKPIGCKVTLRKKDADEFLKRAFEAVEHKLPKSVFDRQGNFSFGVKEHIDLPGVRYDPEVGIFGMDVCVTLERPGYRVKRKRLPNPIGDKHQIKPEDAMEWVQKNYKVEII
jgi:large subunit ribosomal protein L5